MKKSILGIFIAVFTITWTSPSLAQSGGDVESTRESHRKESNHNDPRVDRLISEIRRNTEIYNDRKSAQLAGYLPFGPDIPQMGVHWIHPDLALNRSIDLNRPSTLTYVNVNGKPQLTGVAYTYPVMPGDRPPELPVKEMRWNFYSKDLEEEALGLHQKSAGEEQDKVYLAMVHAWVWYPNPDGYFAPNNWALPYLRLELTPPENPDPDASKALFMVHEAGLEYNLMFVERAAHPRAFDSGEVRKILDRNALKVMKIASGLRRQPEITRQHQQQLADLWHTIWKEIRSNLGEETWPAVEQYLNAEQK